MPKILLVDDEEMNRDFLSRRLQKRGYDVTTANGGAEACAKVESMRPDLVLMDAHMPGMDGLEATRTIRQNPEFQRLPIIMLTAMTMPGDRERMLECGCDEYEGKPIDMPSLIEKMQLLLSRPSAPTTESFPR